MTSATAIYDALTDYMGHTASAEALSLVICETITSHISSSTGNKEHLMLFASHVLRVIEPTVPVLLAALTYIDRYFNATLRFNEQDPVVHFRLFFISLLTAYKYVCERAVANLAWEGASDNLFTLPEINAMERSFLNVLQYDLVCEDPSTQCDWLETVKMLTLNSERSSSITSSLIADSPEMSLNSNFGTVSRETSVVKSKVSANIILKTIFRRIPTLGFNQAKELRDFAYQILNVTNPNYSTILTALTYIDRYFNSKKRFKNETESVAQFQLVLSSFLCAYKYVNERSVKNVAWVRACGGAFDISEINELERKFLVCIKYDLVVEDIMTQTSWAQTIEDVLEDNKALVDMILRTLICGRHTESPTSFHELQMAHSLINNITFHVRPTHSMLLTVFSYILRYLDSKIQLLQRDSAYFCRVILSACICAYKYSNDERLVKNKAWEEIACSHFLVHEINDMERDFLQSIQYDLVVEDIQTQCQWMQILQDLSKDDGDVAPTE
ncbi:hypothetical protein HDU98_010574 [Podochytrium sp. JEL0797]|nr:hypothetical protein HDU98_010574 [Podochytrium sp. JEL0797]